MLFQKKLWLLTLALCAALLCGCGGADQAEAEPEPAEAAQTQEADTSGEAQEAEETAEGEPVFDTAALEAALNDVCAVAPGTAGSNLRAVKAAGELVLFSAANWTEENAAKAADAVTGWFAALDADARDRFRQGLEAVDSQVRIIVDRPWDPEITGPLEDAGLPNLALSAMDLTHAADLLGIIWEKTGG